jgi:hypothetical protein
MEPLYNPSFCPLRDHVTDYNSIIAPTVEEDEEGDEREFTPAEWENLNAFVAQMPRKVVPGFSSFAIWELRDGLESDAKISSSAFHTRVRVACVWLRLNGHYLLQQSLLQADTIRTDSSRSLDPGPLFHGSVGFTLERWSFWKRRLLELHDGSDEALRAPVKEAVLAMADVEMEVAAKIFT